MRFFGQHVELNQFACMKVVVMAQSAASPPRAISRMRRRHATSRMRRLHAKPAAPPRCAGVRPTRFARKGSRLIDALVVRGMAAVRDDVGRAVRWIRHAAGRAIVAAAAIGIGAAGAI